MGETQKILQTERLILCPWEESNAEGLYKYASHPDVVPISGWAVHTSVEIAGRWRLSRVCFLSRIYIVVLKEMGHPVGSIGLMLSKTSNIGIPIQKEESVSVIV